MAKHVYDSYLKTWFWETENGKRTLTLTVEEAVKGPMIPPLKEIKKRWWQFWG